MIRKFSKRLGFVCQQQGKHEEAIEVLQRIIQRAPLYPGANVLLAISYYALNKFDKTIESSQKELTGNPKDRSPDTTFRWPSARQVDYSKQYSI
jgi:tetratricopeptide (TPR) repeat protein